MAMTSLGARGSSKGTLDGSTSVSRCQLAFGFVIAHLVCMGLLPCSEILVSEISDAVFTHKASPFLPLGGLVAGIKACLGIKFYLFPDYECHFLTTR